MRRLVLTASALLALTAAAPAPGRIIRAESVLPPGQSGFVSIAGVATGTGSPHLYDQTDLFTSFRRKPDIFGLPGQSESPRAGVTIVRDAYGVPAVTGDNESDAWWGAGYAIAQDRLFELDLFRRATTGRLAEILGPSYLDDDLIARRDYYTARERTAMFGRLPANLRARFTAYTAGVNAWIAHVRTDPLDLPGEFPATADALTDWTVDDSVAIGIYLARTTPRDDGAELDNTRALQAIGARAFDRVMPLHLRGPATVPTANGAFPSQPGRTRAQERRGFTQAARFVAHLPLPAPKSTGSNSARAIPGRLGGSYMFAVREPGGRAVLFNGPELGFGVPSKLVELELHAPGLDFRGATVPGVPVAGIAHNAHVAWGFTSGESDADDLYADRLTGPDTYRFRGRTRHLTCRTENFTYNTPPSDLTDGEVPQRGSRAVRVCRDVHGPVVARSGGYAYARRYAIWKREIDTLRGLAVLERARTVRDVAGAAARVTWNENIMAADDAGHIGFWHPGLLPLRPRGFDERLPYPGDGRAEWRGFLTVARRPHVIDPARGWLANWNNDPSVAFTNGDGAERPRLDGPFNRAAYLERLVRTLARSPSYAKAEATIRRAGTVAQQRPLADRRLRAALRGATGHARAVLATLVAWDGDYSRTASDGTVAPGVATWDEFKAVIQRLALGRNAAGAAPIAGTNSDEHRFDAPNGQAYGLRTLNAGGYRRAAATAFTRLAARFGTADPARWREPRAMYPVAAQGAGNKPDLPFFDRGTWEQVVELGG